MACVQKVSKYYFGSVRSILNQALLTQIIGMWGGHNESSRIHSIKMFIVELMHGTKISLSFFLFTVKLREIKIALIYRVSVWIS